MKNPNLSREASATRTRDFESEPGVLATRALEFLEPSRDRKGADTRITSKLFGNKQGHSLSLLFGHVPDSLPYILILP